MGLHIKPLTEEGLDSKGNPYFIFETARGYRFDISCPDKDRIFEFDMVSDPQVIFVSRYIRGSFDSLTAYYAKSGMVLTPTELLEYYHSLIKPEDSFEAAILHEFLEPEALPPEVANALFDIGRNKKDDAPFLEEFAELLETHGIINRDDYNQA